MVESDDPGLIDRLRSQIKAHASTTRPLDHSARLSLGNDTARRDVDLPTRSATSGSTSTRRANTTSSKTLNEGVSTSPPLAASSEDTQVHGAESAPIEPKKEGVLRRFIITSKEILLSSPINILLVFVPVGIAVNFAHLNPIIIFAMNAIAIIPLAGLLSHATEAVASTMGDTVGALMNVTFGNAVELIILLVKSKGPVTLD